jgi:hypothetical protein
VFNQGKQLLIKPLFDCLAAAQEDELPADEPWPGRFGSSEDAAQVPVQLRRFHELLAAKASSGR